MAVALSRFVTTTRGGLFCSMRSASACGACLVRRSRSNIWEVRQYPDWRPPIIDLVIGVQSLAEAKAACMSRFEHCATLSFPNTKRGCRPNCSSAREYRVPGPTTSMSWSRPTRAGRTICCFATICALIRRRQAPTELEEVARACVWRRHRRIYQCELTAFFLDQGGQFLARVRRHVARAAMRTFVVAHAGPFIGPSAPAAVHL